MLSNFKLGSKLIGAFLVVAALCALVGVYGAIKLQTTDKAYSDGWAQGDQNLTKVSLLKARFLQLRLDANRLALADNPAHRESVQRDLDSARQKLADSVADYEKTISTNHPRFIEENRRLLEQFKVANVEYLRAIDGVVDCLRENQHDKEIRILQSASSRGVAISALVDQLLDLNMKMAAQISEDITATSHSAFIACLVCVSIGVVLAIALGVAITLMITRPMNKMTGAATLIAKGDLSQTVDYRSGDELGALAEAFRNMVSLLSDRAESAKRIASGDLNITVTAVSEQDTLGKALAEVVSNLRTLLEQMAEMAREHNAGDIDASIDIQKFDGDYRKVAHGINEMVGGHIAVKKKAMACIAEFGKGNFEAPLERFPGKKAFINDTIEQVRANLKALITDANQLVDAAIQGRLATRADAGKHQGDFRKIVEGVNHTLDAVIGPLNDFALVLDSLASGDLTVTATREYAGDFEKFKKSINTVSIQVRQAMQQIGQNTAALVASAEELNKVSQQMSSSADETAAQANVVSAASDQVSKTVQTVATGADEMGASIKEIAKNTAEATKVAIAAVKTAEATNHTIEKLGQSSAEIGQVIKVITSIAQQTNLLALNATIEAARAGEAGKGFAVVANEVKELAKETAKATEDISQKIEAIQADSKGAVSAIAQISTVINQINDIQNTIASAVEEQSATTNEISRNLAEAAKGAIDITKNIGGVAEAARNTTAGAVDTQKSAHSLERMAAELQELVSQFKCDEQKSTLASRPAPSRNKPNGKFVSRSSDELYSEAVQ